MAPSLTVPLTDTHAHLCSPDFARDLSAVLSRAQAAGVAAVIAVGETLADAVRNLELARQHPMIRPAAGLYPTVLDFDEAGYFFSVPPSVVRSRQKQKLVKQLPLSCLLVETDSPVLGPEPTVRNEPANLTRAAEAIAEIKSLPIQAVMEAVAANTARLYGRLNGSAL